VPFPVEVGVPEAGPFEATLQLFVSDQDGLRTINIRVSGTARPKGRLPL
jgi:hypothetical protein